MIDLEDLQTLIEDNHGFWQRLPNVKMNNAVETKE